MATVLIPSIPGALDVNRSARRRSVPTTAPTCSTSAGRWRSLRLASGLDHRPVNVSPRITSPTKISVRVVIRHFL